MKKFRDLPGKTTAVSLQLPMRLEYDEWRAAGMRLAQFKEWTQFAIGDWLLFGSAHYGQEYAQAASETELAEEALQTFQYVAERIDPTRRVKNVSWSHHREVAPLLPSQQSKWLSKCEQEKWSVQELRDRLTEAGLKKKRKGRNSVEGERKQVCTCVGSCKGKEGLGSGWVCAL